MLNIIIYKQHINPYLNFDTELIQRPYVLHQDSNHKLVLDILKVEQECWGVFCTKSIFKY